MSVFNNKNMLTGYVSHVAVHDTGAYKIMFIRLSVFAYMKDDKPHYETINAQISCGVDQQGKLTTTSSHPKALLNKMLFEKLDNNLVEGMKVTIHGSLRGYDQIYLNGQWKNFRDLTVAEKELYRSIPKNQLLTRNQTHIYVEEISMPDKQKYLSRKENQEPENQMNGLKPLEPNQADSLQTDDNDPVDNEGIVVEMVEAEVINREPEPRATRRTVATYVPFENVIYPEMDITEDDLPFN